MSPITRSAAVALALLAPLALSPSAAAGETFTTLKENVFVCVSPQAYDDAMLRVSQLDGRDLEPLKTELSEKKHCMFVDAEMIDRIMAPFAIVLQRAGSKVQIQFSVTFRERVTLLHRMINRYVLVGWTEASNLLPKTIL